MKETIPPSTRAKGFTVIELLVAVSVTALLSGMLLLISTQVLETQSKSSSTLETNQIAQFVLDQIQEDLQCAVYRNDGNVWMAISLLNDNENTGSWVSPSISSNGKSPIDSLRIVNSDWPNEELVDSEIDALGQGPFFKSRFGVGGCWLRFFSQAPELDPRSKNFGSARAIAYQIVRYGLTGAPTSRAKYQLFRSDVSAKNSFEAGYNLHPDAEGYGSSASSNSLDPTDPSTPRVPISITNPILSSGSEYSTTSFSIASNIIDFGIRAYHLEKNSFGTGNLIQIFPPIDIKSPGNLIAEESLATSYKPYQTLPSKNFYLFPDIIDVMVRVLSMEGSRLLEAFESGSVPSSENFNWWSIAEEHSEVYIRRIKIFGSGI